VELEWSIGAKSDLARIYAFNFERSESWAARAEGRLRERAEALRRTPFIGRKIGSTGLRALSAPDFQYILTYRVDGEQVTILAVHSTREDR
jgi:plasmid stabilization system protein ParE